MPPIQQRSMRMPVLHRLAAFVLVLLLGGCSGNFIYNRLDTLAGWYLDSLVSLSESQRAQLQDWLSQTLSWHRESELRRYSQFLRDLSGELSQPGTMSGYEQAQHRFEGFWDDLLDRAAPEASRLLLSLSPQQVDELIQNMEEKARERSKEAADIDEWRDDQVKDMVRQMRRWTGSVSPQQRDLIEKATAQIEPTRQEWLASQQSWRSALQQALVNPPSAQAAMTRIRQLLLHADNEWTQEYVEKSQRNRLHYLELVTSLDATLSTQQRDRLRSELLKLAQQLDVIAKEKS